MRKGQSLPSRTGLLKTTLPIPADTQDLISCLYYVRNQLPMTQGASLILNIHHDKKNRRVEVRVEHIETLEGTWGERGKLHKCL